MNILVKFPTRGRPTRFIETLDLYYAKAEDLSKLKFLVSCDLDDESMNNVDMRKLLSGYKNLSVVFGSNKSKIEAVNADIKIYSECFDIILLASDDMIPVIDGYDEIIRRLMVDNFPDTDGVLWFNDGIQGINLNTLCILGKKYYDRFGYIYNPEYKSFYCDNEFTEVSISLNKCLYVNEVIIEHKHFCVDETLLDKLYIINDKYAEFDRQTWLRRKSKNYNI